MIGPGAGVFLLLSVLLSAGCGAAEGDVRAAGSVAADFVSALAAEEGSEACDLLSAAARQEIESGGEPCAEELLQTSLPPGNPSEVPVWSDEALVRYGETAVFLHRFADGWRVTAAGCDRVPGRPYECSVEG